MHWLWTVERISRINDVLRLRSLFYSCSYGWHRKLIGMQNSQMGTGQSQNLSSRILDSGKDRSCPVLQSNIRRLCNKDGLDCTNDHSINERGNYSIQRWIRISGKQNWMCGRTFSCWKILFSWLWTMLMPMVFLDSLKSGLCFLCPNNFQAGWPVLHEISIHHSSIRVKSIALFLHFSYAFFSDKSICNSFPGRLYTTRGRTLKITKIP